MRGRKPKITKTGISPQHGATVTSLRTQEQLEESHGQALREAERRVARMVRKQVKRLMPKDLSPAMRGEFLRVGAMLAHPNVDRLKPHYLDVILQYCWLRLRLRGYQDFFRDDLNREIYSVGGPNDPAAPPPAADGKPAPKKIGRPATTRNGVQIKVHPQVVQRNETWRQWRSMVAILGLSPTDERNLAPGLGEIGDPTDKYFG